MRTSWMRTSWIGVTAAACLSLLGAACPARAAEFDQTRPVEGLRQNLPQIYAFANARIVVAPGRMLETGNLVVRDGVIVAVGKDVPIPSEATHWDLTGKVIYPGLIDALSEVDVDSAESKEGTGYWSPQVQPQRSVADVYATSADQNQAFRSQGITVRLAAPRDGIIKGRSAIFTTGDADLNQSLLRADAALHLRLGAPRQRSRDQFPNSPMGAVALARQAIYDAVWYRDAWQVFRAQTGAPRPEQNSALEALQPYIEQQQLVLIDTPDEQYLLRGDRFAREFGLARCLRGIWPRIPAVGGSRGDRTSGHCSGRLSPAA